MPKALRPSIDTYALMVSPFVASTFHVVGVIIMALFNIRQFWNVLFWQSFWALAFVPIYLVLTIPLCWFLARYFKLPKVRSHILLILILSAAFTMVAISFSPYFGASVSGMLYFYMLLAGLITNALSFCWLNIPSERLKRQSF